MAVVCFLPLRSVDVVSVTYVRVFVSQLFGLGVDDGEQLLPPRISVVVFVTSVVCFWPLRSVDVSCVTVVRVFVSQLFGAGGGARVLFDSLDLGFDDGEQLLPP